MVGTAAVVEVQIVSVAEVAILPDRHAVSSALLCLEHVRAGKGG